MCKSPDLFTSPRYNHFLDTWCVTDVTGSPLHSFLSCLPGLQAIQVLPLCPSVEICYLGCCQCLDAIVATTGRVDAKNTREYLPSTNNRKENNDLMGSPCNLEMSRCLKIGVIQPAWQNKSPNNFTNIP